MNTTHCACPYANDCIHGHKLRIICEHSNPCSEYYHACHHYLAKREEAYLAEHPKKDELPPSQIEGSPSWIGSIFSRWRKAG